MSTPIKPSEEFTESLKALGFAQLTPMQEDYLTDRGDFCRLLANTGSGKTLAYLLRIERFLRHSTDDKSVMIVCPTRELAIQSEQVIRKLGWTWKAVCCYGGHPVKTEREQLQAKPRIVVGTPGRLLDHFERETPGMPAFELLVLDEYDKTLEMGFYDEINALLRFSKPLKHIQLVSATPIAKLPDFMEDVVFSDHDYRAEGQTLSYFTVKAKEQDKLKALALLLTQLDLQPKIIFCSHREAVDRIAAHLREYGKPVSAFHGGMEQDERERAMVRFRFGEFDCLLATDLAARGLDIPDVTSVIHYQYPHTEAEFIHRNGRCGRMGKAGEVYLLHSSDEPLPEYLRDYPSKRWEVPENFTDYAETGMITLYVSAGRKQKIRKTDLIGALTGAGITFESIGAVQVQDNYSYLAIKKDVYQQYRQILTNIKIKKKNTRISICR